MAEIKYEELSKALSENELLWGMLYCKTYFRKESPLFHLRVLEDSLKFPNLAVQAPRGSAKSVLLTFLKPSHGIAHKKFHFIIIVQNTYAKAAASLNNIKAEFKENKAVIQDYQIKLIKDAEGDTVFQHPDGFKTRVLCKGADQLGSIRGERFGAYRPDLILIDDLEDDEMVRNAERRSELEKQFNEVIKYAGDGDTRIIVIGTILHDDSLMAKLVSKYQYKNFRKLFFQAKYTWKGEVCSLWPQKWSLETLAQMEAEDPSGFAKEMQGDPSSGSMETMSRENFRYWTIENNQAILFDENSHIKARYDLSDCKAAISCDLAWEEKRDSDFSVIFPAFMTPNSEILFEEHIYKKGLRPEELEEILFSMTDRLEALTKKRVPIGFEKAKLEKVAKHLLGLAMRRRNRYLWLKDLQWDGDKLQRIYTRLSNRYAQHSIYHKRGMGELENQLIRLRSVAHDDLADGAQGVVQLLQFAPQKKKPTQPEDTFKFWQKQTPRYKEKNRSNYVFGIKSKVPQIKSVLAAR